MKNSTRYILYGIFSTLFLSVLIAIFIGYGRQANDLTDASLSAETAAVSAENETAAAPAEADDREAGYTTLLDRALIIDDAASEQTAADLAKAFDDDEDGLITALAAYSSRKEEALSPICSVLVYGKSRGDLGAFEMKIVSAGNAETYLDRKAVLDEIRNAIREYKENH